MRIIISPAKKMHEDADSLEPLGPPRFLPEAERLLSVLRPMPLRELKALWQCSDAIAALNAERLRRMDLRGRQTPAVLSYEGIQYQYMAPGVFETGQFAYLQEHLRILSGFYGLLRPFDGVVPYRLEMQARLPVDGHRGQARAGAGRGDGPPGQPRIGGVQPGGEAASAAPGAVPHLHLRGVEGGAGDRKGNALQDGAGTDGAVAGGKQRHRRRGHPGVPRAGIPV